MKLPKLTSLARFDHVSLEGLSRSEMENVVALLQKTLERDAESFGVQLANGQFKAMTRTASGSHQGSTIRVGGDAKLCEFGC